MALGQWKFEIKSFRLLIIMAWQLFSFRPLLLNRVAALTLLVSQARLPVGQFIQAEPGKQRHDGPDNKPGHDRVVVRDVRPQDENQPRIKSQVA